MIDVKNKHITIAGAARSGVAAAILLKRKGAIPFLSDTGEIRSDFAEKLHKESIEFEENAHTEKAMQGDFLVMSPGVPTSSSIAQSYLNDNKPVFSEIEMASWFNRSPIIAVTGSNGKTTVANWMHHTWTTAQKEHIVAGNIGYAFSELVDQTDENKDVLLEVSSFQLDHIDTFKPTVSMILNITPDHMNRYDNDIEKYAASKYRIAENQTSDDWFIFNSDDNRVSGFAKKLSERENAPKMMAFSTKSEVPNGAFIQNGQLILRLDNKEEILMDIDDIALPGKHNLSNGMATALAARASEIRNEHIRESLRSFEGVEHRLEFVRTYNGVKYINDSKATNINAVWFALDSFNVPIVLILGGRDKGNNYQELESQLREKVHTVIAIGEAREAIKNQLKSTVPNLTEAETMKEAVKKASKTAKRGEVVLLSPACASFDMFENYEHRGEVFKQAVLEL
ncbi:UDP-N-acetylmuramoyl-L-alanine--D-glutamate ligase [Rhodohalobacter barkolensis]|uniref:UDP-N-acetylmuramoylalanine--D-glutamate ligase n=1 Tax=Rhodohalobacter barkolensis TaxID=2053187 RepID=A0A2N0VL78_9BACT|nr:UDP-N-acetylmuramoyl-L-alanine--D-glutamate ligase [Rhodohalobacter barkolensis]PKD44956.1 UDP-N-acetylmuramoyl-L-alanine--D-glutamate ligase [Rhodohalobacter barkolensis]